jgi:hypothetical protein
MTHYSRKGYQREASPNIFPKRDDWVTLVSSSAPKALAHSISGGRSTFAFKWAGGQGTSITSRLPFVSSHSLQFALSADPSQWGSNLSLNHPEPDDNLHNPEVKDGKVIDHSIGSFRMLSARGVANLGCLWILCLTIVALLYDTSSAVPVRLSSTTK